MSREETYTKLTEIFREVFDDDDVVATPSLVAADVDDWDSLSNIRMIVSVEQEFGLMFSTAEIADLKNVGELVSVIEGKLG